MYRYVPFDVRLTYDRSMGTIDLGVIDATQFRGWSGGARDEVWVTPEWATPGYSPGEVQDGTWQVMLGLYRVGEGGVPFEIEIEASSSVIDDPWAQDLDGVQPEPRPSLRNLPAEEGRHWMACDFHSHSIHSDGALALLELARYARQRGLDALAVTDHNTVSHHPHLAATAKAAGVILIPGQEVTTAEGHANCVGPVRWIDFRMDTDAWIATAKEDGGILSLNHPVHPMYSWHRPRSVPAHGVELWHSSWDGHDLGPQSFWEELGRPIALGGSDFHRYGERALESDGDVEVGSPTTWVEVDESGDVVAGLRECRTALSVSPSGPLALRVADEIVVIDGEGLILEGPTGRFPITARLVRRNTDGGLHRLVDGSGTVYALVPN